MMIRCARYVLAVFLLVCLCGIALAKAVPPRKGSVKTYSSANGRYKVEIEILGYPDKSPSTCIFKERGEVVWNGIISATPGVVNIADNGASIVMAIWGWYDEGGYRGLLFYDKSMNFLNEVVFGESGTKDSIVWIDDTAISPDGVCYMLGTHEAASQAAKLYLYLCKDGSLIWQKEYRQEDAVIEVAAIEVSQGGDAILVAMSSLDNRDMVFMLLDNRGDCIWEKKIPGNFSWSIKDYLRLDSTGTKFSIFERSSQKWLPCVVRDGKVIEK